MYSVRSPKHIISLRDYYFALTTCRSSLLSIPYRSFRSLGYSSYRRLSLWKASLRRCRSEERPRSVSFQRRRCYGLLRFSRLRLSAGHELAPGIITPYRPQEILLAFRQLEALFHTPILGLAQQFRRVTSTKPSYMIFDFCAATWMAFSRLRRQRPL